MSKRISIFAAVLLAVSLIPAVAASSAPDLDANQSSLTLTVSTQMSPFTLTNDGGEVITWQIQPELPAGLIFTAANLTLHGSPHDTHAAQVYTFSGVNDDGNDSYNLSIWVDADLDMDGIADALDTDDDGDGYADGVDAFPRDGLEWADFDGDGTGDNADTDDDDDGWSDWDEAQCGSDSRNESDVPADFDGDGICDLHDADDDGDGVDDASDAFPLDASAWEAEEEELPPNADFDTDDDGFSDVVEVACASDQNNASVTPVDTDGDGMCDFLDSDDDGDGVFDAADDAPLDASIQNDLDGDGIDDAVDQDDDGDGIPDFEDPFPRQANGTVDSDGDGIPDHEDPDRDGDGVGNCADAFPDDSTEWRDSDGDGIGDNVDDDVDGDGASNAWEAVCGSDPGNETSIPGDLDGDETCDFIDDDTDDDGVGDCGDAFPLDANESVDTDGDGIGDVSDLDADGDGWNDSVDAFPLDRFEWFDADGDGVGDNLDADDDGDGLNDSFDAFPWNANETHDFDGDGIGDNADVDDDGDGWNDSDDAFPFNASEWLDADLDAIGNNADADDDGDGWLDAMEFACGSDPLDASDVPADANRDGICDVLEEVIVEIEEEENETVAEENDTLDSPVRMSLGAAEEYCNLFPLLFLLLFLLLVPMLRRDDEEEIEFEEIEVEVEDSLEEEEAEESVLRGPKKPVISEAVAAPIEPEVSERLKGPEKPVISEAATPIEDEDELDTSILDRMSWTPNCLKRVMEVHEIPEDEEMEFLVYAAEMHNADGNTHIREEEFDDAAYDYLGKEKPELDSSILDRMSWTPNCLKRVMEAHGIPEDEEMEFLVYAAEMHNADGNTHIREEEFDDAAYAYLGKERPPTPAEVPLEDVLWTEIVLRRTMEKFGIADEDEERFIRFALTFNEPGDFHLNPLEFDQAGAVFDEEE